jgi:dTDP-4-dehydrorhamnose 3,5-epimerase-like enzyme
MFAKLQDDFGYLVPMSFIEMPFLPVRTFLVGGVPEGTIRGNHAHKTCHQLLVCLTGKVICEVTKSDGSSNSIILSSPTDALHMPPNTWGRQTYIEPGTQLLVFASHEYDETDYIRDWERFLNIK